MTREDAMIEAAKYDDVETRFLAQLARSEEWGEMASYVLNETGKEYLADAIWEGK